MLRYKVFGTQSPPDEFRERQGGCVCSNQTDSSLSLCAFLYFFSVCAA